MADIKFEIQKDPVIKFSVRNPQVRFGVNGQYVVSADYGRLTNKPQINGQTLEAGNNELYQAELAKLAGIETGAEVNQNAFGNVEIGGTTLAADQKQDTLIIEAGENVTITPNHVRDSFVINAKDTVYANATSSRAGLMSAADFVKLAGIETGANYQPQSDWNAVSGNAVILNKPTAVSAFQNDAGYINGVYFWVGQNRYKVLLIMDRTVTAPDGTEVHGFMVHLDDGTVDGQFVFFPDGNGLLDIMTIIENMVEARYTDAEKTKLAGIQAGATANTAASTNPLMDGTATPGVQLFYAKGDHVHPTDTSRAPIDSPTFTGTPAAQTAANGTMTTQLATTEFVGKAAATIPFGKVDSTSTATAFTAQIPGITELRNGVCAFITNGVVTSAANCTLNINGLGAKRIYNTMGAATAVSTTFNKDYTMLFVYNESRVSAGCWDMYYGYNSDTNTIAYNIRKGNGPMKCKTVLYRYEICFTIDEEYILPANAVSNKPTTYTKALTTEAFDPFGDIYFYSTTSTVNADANVSANYMYTAYSATDLRYAFNTGSTLTANKYVYLVCDPQTDGKVKLASNPITQVLPTTEDGHVYIKLGRAYDTYRIALDQNKPVYYFKGGALRLWAGPDAA